MAINSEGISIHEYESYTYEEKIVYGLYNHNECNCTNGMNRYYIYATTLFVITIYLLAQAKVWLL